MTDYNKIIDAELGHEAPVRESLWRRLRDNLLATVEGATGAPRIRTRALQPPSPGTRIVGRRILGTQEFTAAGTTEPDGAAIPTNSGLAWTVIVPGTIRVRFDHRRNPDGDDHPVYAKVWHNQNVIGSWSTSSTSFTERTVDVTVGFQDVIRITHWGTYVGGFPPNPGTASISGMRSAHLLSDSENLCVI